MSNKRQQKQAEKSSEINHMRIPQSDGVIKIDTTRFKTFPGRQVYQDAMGMQYSADLNCSNIGGNNNKFYKVQIHKFQKSFILYARYGRVGNEGVMTEKTFNDENECVKQYISTFKSKQNKGYVALKLKTEDEKLSQSSQSTQASDVSTSADSKLDDKVLNLMKFITDKEAMKKTMMNQGIDMTKMSLSNLSEETIKQGLNYLCQIEAILSKDSKTNKNKQKEQIQDLSGKFYSYIPHSFGFKKMIDANIDTLQKVKDKLELIDSLIGINSALKVQQAKKAVGKKRSKKEALPEKLKGISQAKQKSLPEHPMDIAYDGLNCKIKSVAQDSKEFKMIDKYIKNTGSNTNCLFGNNKQELLEVFDLQKQGWDYNPKKLGNNKLLWHGTRATNIADILYNSLRIAPPNAPKCGYALGKGSYFSDAFQLSRGFTHSYFSGGVGLLLLCEVALGNPAERKTYDQNVDDFVKNSKGKYDSCHGIGRLTSDPAQKQIIKQKKGHQLEVPLGPLIERQKQSCGPGYNEFVVYNTNQINMKYLVKVKLN